MQNSRKTYQKLLQKEHIRKGKFLAGWTKSSTAMALLTRRTLGSFLSRVLSSSSLSSPIHPRLALSVLGKQHQQFSPESRRIPSRPKTSGSGYSPLNDPSPNWSNRPPKETILLDGCDYEHWLIVMEFNEDPKPSEEEMIAAYIRTLTAVVGRCYNNFTSSLI